jgi:hypothetical protein
LGSVALQGSIEKGMLWLPPTGRVTGAASETWATRYQPTSDPAGSAGTGTPSSKRTSIETDRAENWIGSLS